MKVHAKLQQNIAVDGVTHAWVDTHATIWTVDATIWTVTYAYPDNTTVLQLISSYAWVHTHAEATG